MKRRCASHRELVWYQRSNKESDRRYEQTFQEDRKRLAFQFHLPPYKGTRDRGYWNWNKYRLKEK